MPKSAHKGKHAAASRRRRLKVAEELILPTAPNQYGTTALVSSDLSSRVTKHLAPYNTIGNQNYFWRAISDSGTLVQSTLADAAISLFFTLSATPGSSDFIACFDQYRLRAVSVEFMPMITSTMAASTAVYLPRLYTCIDYDDAGTLTRSAIQQYDTCVVSPPGTGVVRTLVPRMAVAAYSGSFTSYANVSDMWLDAASPSVQHFGVKAVLESGPSGQTILQTYLITATSFWEFRATR